jgi:biofilm PGA synthesis protein PgaD
MIQEQPPRIPELILRSDLVESPRKELLAVVAMIGWGIWLYIISPVFSLLAWWFGYLQLSKYVLNDPVGLVTTLRVYAVAIALGGLLFIFWAVYNWIRFRNSHRRGVSQIASPGDIGLGMGLTEAAVLFAQQHRLITFTHDDIGQVINIEETRS